MPLLNQLATVKTYLVCTLKEVRVTKANCNFVWIGFLHLVQSDQIETLTNTVWAQHSMQKVHLSNSWLHLIVHSCYRDQEWGLPQIRSSLEIFPKSSHKNIKECKVLKGRELLIAITVVQLKPMTIMEECCKVRSLSNWDQHNIIKEMINLLLL